MDFPKQITEKYKNYLFERVRVSTITPIAKGESLTYDQVKGIVKRDLLKKKLVGKLRIDEFSHRQGYQQFATVIGD